MTQEGVDYSGTHPGGAALRAAGKTFVCRYVPYNNVTKGITRAEISDLRSHGISIAMVFEMFADDPLRGGYARGQSDARLAVQGMNLVGLPSTMPIYFACDWDASAAQQTAIDAYLRGCASIIGAARVGVYGGYNVIARCYASGTAKWFWQTYAWSSGRLHPATHIYQYHNGARINGIEVDLNRSLKSDFGQYPRPSGSPAPAPTPIPLPTPTPIGGREGLPVSFISRNGWHAAIIKGKPRRSAPSLTAHNFGNTTKDESFVVWGEVKGSLVAGSTRWFFGSQYIGAWRTVFIPLIDLKNRNF